MRKTNKISNRCPAKVVFFITSMINSKQVRTHAKGQRFFSSKDHKKFKISEPVGELSMGFFMMGHTAGINSSKESHHQDGTAITGEFYPSQTPRKPVRDTGKQMGIETILLNFNQWNLLKKFDALPKPATSDLGDPEMEIEEINLNAWKNYDGDSCSWESLRRICRYQVLMFSLVLTKERKTFLSEILFLGFYCLISSIIIYIIYYNI